MRSIKAIFLIAACAWSQVPADPLPRDPKAALNPAPQGMVQAIADAVKANDVPRAMAALMDAMAYDPTRRELVVRWVDLMAKDTTDPNARWLLTRLGTPTFLDEKGGLPEDIKGLLGKLDPAAAKLFTLRADAAMALLNATKDKASALADPAVRPLLARRCASLAATLLSGAPLLRARVGKPLTESLAFTPEWKPILQALKEEMDRALSDGRPHEAARFARNLLGFAAQAAFKDLKGPPAPNLTSVAMAARAGLARARAAMEGPKRVPLTVEELESMPKGDREAFTSAHNDWSNPGVAVSPKGLYRIETTCGHETLLGTAKTVEYHHARLVGWFGKDPFTGRQGLIRIVPRSSGLESEGVPYWWAGGFQSGDTTTVKFAVGTIEGLGHTLTHELTHRFDGALAPGMPAWAVEGRASWTGTSYGFSQQAEFVDGHMSFGTNERAFIKGYGGEENFTKLLKGTIDDYRDNYTAGYALWVYLKYWNESDGSPPLYADRIPTWIEMCGKGQGVNPVAFAAAYCDGKKGRPKDLKEFSKKFGTFLQGFYWQNRAPWTARFEKKIPGADAQDLVADGPTWNDDRDRSEPQFGQDHAREAGLLLASANRPKEALLALTWGLLADEYPRDVAEAYITVAKKAGKLEAAWLVESEIAARMRATPPSLPPGELRRVLTPVIVWMDALASASVAANDQKATLAASALASDAQKIAFLLGKPQVAPYKPSAVLLTAKSAFPVDPPAEHLAITGFEEDDLSGYEEKRIKGLWYETPDADLIVGRSKPKEGTGDTDRGAAQVHAYARSKAWMPSGHHIVTMRIAALTSFVSGSIVIGCTRRDRQVRLDLSMGDFLYSIGAKEDVAKIKGVMTSIRGMREREGALPGAYPSKHVDFKEQRTFFDVELSIDGPEVSATVDGVYVGCYRMPDGWPIEGQIGFATGQGAWRISKPSVRNVRASTEARTRLVPRLNLSEPLGAELDRLLHRTVTGVPLAPSGTILVCLPRYGMREEPEKPASRDELLRLATDLGTAAADAISRELKNASWVFMVPDVLQIEDIAALQKTFATASTKPSAIVTHNLKSLAMSPEGPDQQMLPAMGFVDPVGGLRVLRPFNALLEGLPGDVSRWAQVYDAIARAPAR